MCLKFLFNLFNKGIQIPQKLLKNNEILFYAYNSGTVDLGSKMLVNEGYIGFVCYKNKIIYTFSVGTHTLTRYNIPEIVSKFDRKEIKAKRVKANVYFVNIGVQKTDFFVKDKHYVFENEKISPLLLDCKIEYKVLKPNLFLDYIQYIMANPTNDKVTNNIKYKLYDLIETYVQKNAMPKNDTYMYFEKLKSKVYNSFNDIGLSISNVELTRLEVTEKTKNKRRFNKKDTSNNSPKSFFDDVPKLPDVYMKLDQSTNGGDTQTQKYEFFEKTYGEAYRETIKEDPPIPNEYKYCPVCEQRVLSVSKYCNRCGHQF